MRSSASPASPSCWTFRYPVCPIVVSTVLPMAAPAAFAAQRVDQVDERLHPRQRAAREPAPGAAGVQACPERCFLAGFGSRRREQRAGRRFARRGAGGLVDAARPDAAGRGVDDAPEADVVVGVDDHLQVGEGVLDLLAFVEADVADDVVRDLGPAQRVLDAARLRVRAIEHGCLSRGVRLAGDDAGDGVGLVVFGLGAQVLDRVARGAPGPQGLVGAVLVAGDERGRGGDDVAARAVIALEVDDGALGEVLLERPDVSDVGAAPAVDGLVGVADGADVAVVAGEQVGQLVLRVVGVLVLVDQDVPVAGGVLLADPVVPAQQGDGAQQQVVEVERAGAAQDLLVLLEAVDELCVAVAVFRGPQLVRGEHPVLPLVDLPDQAARGQRVLVVVELLYREACGLELVGGVVDGEARGDVDVSAVGAQDAGRRRRGRWTAGRSARGCPAGGRAGRASRWRPCW